MTEPSLHERMATVESDIKWILRLMGLVLSMTAMNVIGIHIVDPIYMTHLLGLGP